MQRLFGIPADTLATVLLVALAVVLGAITALALRHRVFLRLGLRNSVRRRSRSVVIVLGLMLATAIVAAALGTGDTMTRTIRSSVISSLGSTDELVTVRTAETDVPVEGAQSSDLGYFPAVDFDAVRARVAGSTLIDGVAPAIGETIAAQNVTRRATEPRLTLFAPDPGRLAGFGRITDLAGAPARLDALRAGEIYLDAEAADRLGAGPGDQLRVFAGGQLVAATVRAIVRFDGSGSDRGAILLPLARAQELLGRAGAINRILVSNAGDELGGEARTAAVRKLLGPTLGPLGLEARPVKSDGLELADAQGNAFMTLFSTFGTFTIAAGILLIFLIFVMLAAERRSEMGTARAVGMQRRHLVETFLYEGLAYDLLAAAVGTAAGLAIAYGMVEVVAAAFTQAGQDLDIVHGLSRSTIVISYALGVLLTFVVVTFSAWRVSLLNIVRAIRDLPEPPRRSRGRHVGAAAGVLVIGVGLTAAGASGGSGTPFLLGVSLVIVALVLVGLAAGLPTRIAYTAGGLAIVGWWLLPFRTYRALVPELQLDYGVWVVSGLMVVLGTTWALVANADLLGRAATRVLGRFRILAPVLRTALAYPVRNRFRTGTTVALFTLVVFTLVVGAATSEAFTKAATSESAYGGGFDVRADVAPAAATADLRDQLAQVPGLDSSAFEVVAAQSFVPVEIRQPGKGAPPFADYPVRGLDDAFLRATTFGLGARARGYRSDRAVWDALRTTPGLAVVDGFATPHRDNWGFGPLPEFQLRGFFVDDGTFDAVPLDVRDPQTGTVTRLRVIGVLKDSAPLTMLGVSTSQETLAPLGERALPTGFAFRLAPGVDADATAKRLESAFLASGMQAQSIDQIVDDALGASLTVQRIVLGFLGLGLVIGVAALGVVAARSVVERRQQIGVLRAIGFQRPMVQASFLLESSLVALGAIVLGTALGVVLSYNIVSDAASRPNWSDLTYRLPWGMLALVFGSVYLAALLAAFVPARHAARVAPASALRYQ